MQYIFIISPIYHKNTTNFDGRKNFSLDFLQNKKERRIRRSSRILSYESAHVVTMSANAWESYAIGSPLFLSILCLMSEGEDYVPCVFIDVTAILLPNRAAAHMRKNYWSKKFLLHNFL